MYIVHVHVHVHVCIVCCALREARQPKVAAPGNIARGTLVKKNATASRSRKSNTPAARKGSTLQHRR